MSDVEKVVSKVFTDEELRSTLVELGLAPQAALFVQVADDE